MKGLITVDCLLVELSEITSKKWPRPIFGPNIQYHILITFLVLYYLGCKMLTKYDKAEIFT